MQPVFKHQWNVTPSAAIQIQKQIKSKVRRSGGPARLKLVGAADISYSKTTDTMYAAIALFEYPSLKLVEEATAKKKAAFPYVPGLLSFREAPALLCAFAKLHNTPQLMIYDGQGVAHPRGVGLGSHMGVIFDTPSIGCAKSRLIGEHREPGKKRGCWVPLTLPQKKATSKRTAVIGRVLRTRDNVKPVFVSVGHRVSLDWSVNIILSLCRGYRLPEVIRYVHNLSNKFRKNSEP